MPAPDEVIHKICEARQGLQIEEEIGEPGGQKWVYRANDPAFGPCCLKIIQEGGTTEQARLGRELLVLQETDQCPNLPKLFFAPAEPIAIGDRAYPWYLEELLVGETLSELIGTPWEEQECLRLIRDVGTAINELWTRKVVHRDIKPENIFCTERGYVLLDPGMARHQVLPPLTPPGRLPGTRGYRSPEQYRLPGERLDARHDIFQLGVVAFVVLTGHHPFNREDAAEAWANNPYHGPDDVLGELGEHVSTPMQKLLTFMLSPYPHQRYRSPDRLLRVVQGMIEEGGE